MKVDKLFERIIISYNIKMIPIIELETWLGIIITTTIIILRLYYCSSRFDHSFLINFLTIAIITSLIWFLYGYSIGMKGLTLPFGIAIIIYIIVIIYLTYCGRQT